MTHTAGITSMLDYSAKSVFHQNVSVIDCIVLNDVFGTGLVDNLNSTHNGK